MAYWSVLRPLEITLHSYLRCESPDKLASIPTFTPWTWIFQYEYLSIHTAAAQRLCPQTWRIATVATDTPPNLLRPLLLLSMVSSYFLPIIIRGFRHTSSLCTRTTSGLHRPTTKLAPKMRAIENGPGSNCVPGVPVMCCTRARTLKASTGSTWRLRCFRWSLWSCCC